MKKVNKRTLRYIDAITDILLIWLACRIAFLIRFDILDGQLGTVQLASLPRQAWLNAAYMLLLAVWYYFNGRYFRENQVRIAKEFTDVLLPNIGGIAFYTAMLYMGRFPDFSRIAIALIFALSTVFVSGKRVILILLNRSRNGKGFIQKHVVLAGGGDTAGKYLDEIRKNPQCGIGVCGYFAEKKTQLPLPYLGDFSGISSELSDRGIEEIVIAPDWADSAEIHTLINVCERSGIRTGIMPFYNDYLPNRPYVEIQGDCKLIHIRTIPLDDALAAAYKRTIDILFSLLALVVCSPIMLITALAICITDPGPVIFSQTRVGRNKKLFRMYKFRSMRLNTDNTEWSVRADTRRTAVGRIIRKFSIDELPQLWNVLKGDMSLVGPRPELPNFVSKFENEIPRYMIRHEVRPGITGVAQVEGLRGDTDIEERARRDIWYIENWTWLLDIRILLRTVLGGFINDETLRG